MISIDQEYYSEYIIQKSKFYSYAYPVFSEEECKNKLDDLHKKYNDATHICFAYILSSPRVERCSDDGEPAGTAGKPIIELLKKKKLENILVAVIRYFGGIKLGAGGLVRAYTNSANLSLENSKIVSFKKCKKYFCEIGHDGVSKLLSTIENNGGKVTSITYFEKVNIEFVCENVDKVKQIFWDIEFREIGEEIVCQ